MPSPPVKEVGRGSCPQVYRVKHLWCASDMLSAFSYKSSYFSPCINITKLVIIAPVLQGRKMELRELTDEPRIPKLINGRDGI